MAGANQAEIDALLAERAKLSTGTTDNVTSMQFTPGTAVNGPTPEQQAEMDALMTERAKLTGEAPPVSMALVPKPVPPATPGVVQLSGEGDTNELPPSTWPEAFTPQRFSKNRRADLEDLPDLIRAPAIRSMAGATAMATNAGTDEVAKIITANNPGTEIETTPEGYKVYRFPGDPQKYAWKPGIHLSDIGRNIPGAGLMAGLGMATAPFIARNPGLRVPTAMATSAITAVLGELMQKHYGGDFDPAQVAIAGALPGVIPAGRFAMGKTAQLAGYLTSELGQTAEGVAPRLMDRARQLLTSWGADPDASALGQRLANITQPVADQAETEMANAAANTGTATAAAAAKADAGTLAAQTQADARAGAIAANADAGTLAAQTRAEDAAAVASTQARDATAAAKAKARDAVAAAAAQQEQAALAANAPVAAVHEQAKKAIEQWAPMDVSSLDRKFMDRVHGFLEDSTNKGKALFGQIEKGMPATAPVTPRPELDNAQQWIADELKKQGKLPSPMLQKAQALLTPEIVEGTAAPVPPEVGTITRLRQLASDAGFKGDFATEKSGTGKKLADLLTKIEYSVAKEHGMDGLVAEARAEVAGRKVTERALKQALTLKGARALNASVVPLIDATGTAMQKGNAEPLRRLMSIIPKGMEQEVMATTVQKAMLDSAPADPVKAVQHIADFVNSLKTQKVVGARVFGMLPEAAKHEILSIGADAEAAIARRSAALAAADAERAAATQAAGRVRDAELSAIQQGKADAGLAIRRAKTAELATVGGDKADTLAAMGRDKAAALAAVGGEKAGTIAAARSSEAAAGQALSDANKANINLVSTMKSAGNALVSGDVKPLNDMVATVGGRIPRHKVVASTLYHAIIDPTKEGAEGLADMAPKLIELEANPAARGRLLSLLPREASGPGGLKDLTALSRIVHGGTAAGAQRAEGLLGSLASMGAWVTGKTGGVVGGGLGLVAGTAMGGPIGGAIGSAVGSGGGFLGGRMLSSALSGARSAATQAANKALMSAEGKELLQRLSLDLPVTQSLLRRVGQNKALQWFLGKAGTPPGKVGPWLESAVNAGAKQALTVNRTEE